MFVVNKIFHLLSSSHVYGKKTHKTTILIWKCNCIDRVLAKFSYFEAKKTFHVKFVYFLTVIYMVLKKANI